MTNVERIGMREAVIVSAVRTAVGKAPKGTLRFSRPDDLGAIAVKEAVARVPELDVREVEDVIIGCAMPEAEQGQNVARLISLAGRAADRGGCYDGESVLCFGTADDCAGSGTNSWRGRGCNCGGWNRVYVVPAVRRK